MATTIPSHAMGVFLLFLLGCTGEPVEPAALPPIVPASPEVLRLMVVGDTGKDTPTRDRVVQASRTVCAARGCDALILLGDNVYPRGVQPGEEARSLGLLEPWGTVGVPVYAVLGNHDWGHGNDHAAADAQLQLADGLPWLHLATDWTASAGPATLLALDTTRIFWDGAGRSAWLPDAVARASGWRVVIGHHPLRSTGPHGDAGTYEGWPWVPWLSGRAVEAALTDGLCGAADLYLAGHDHSRQWLEACGVQLVVSGAGASTTKLEDRGHAPRFASPTPGLAWVRLGHDLTIAFHDADGQLEHEGHVAPPPRLAGP